MNYSNWRTSSWIFSISLSSAIFSSWFAFPIAFLHLILLGRFRLRCYEGVLNVNLKIFRIGWFLFLTGRRHFCWSILAYRLFHSHIPPILGAKLSFKFLPYRYGVNEKFVMHSIFEGLGLTPSEVFVDQWTSHRRAFIRILNAHFPLWKLIWSFLRIYFNLKKARWQVQYGEIFSFP